MNDHGGGGGGDFGGGGFSFGGGHHDAGGGSAAGGHQHHQHHQEGHWNPTDPANLAGPTGMAGFDRDGGRVIGSQRYQALSAGARVTRSIIRLVVIAVFVVVIAFIVYVALHLFAGGGGG
jgi:hypothetical protein